jgi:hypothetical protein
MIKANEEALAWKNLNKSKETDTLSAKSQNL